MVDRFNDRERRDVDRLKRVLAFIGHQGCYARYLLDYFGETRADCGHCGWCNGERPGKMPSLKRRPLAEKEAAFVREVRAKHGKALGTSRQAARFLCGITSPGLSRAKLTKEPAFGAWAGEPFLEVMRFVERT
jgi:ATP-dependent DNA helicase RecQ